MHEKSLKLAKPNIISFLMMFGFASISLQSKAQTLDQSQLIYTGGMSARTLNGYSEWQSFKAGISGTLTEIKMGSSLDLP